MPYTPQSIPRKVVHMDDLKDQKVVQSNDLVTSMAKMDKVPLKIFELAVSCIDTDNLPRDHTVYLSKSTVYSFFQVTDNDKHTRFKSALTTLHQQSIFEVREENEQGKWKYKIISPISSSEWNDYSDTLKIKFTDEIMPYLIELKTNFTQYLITDIMELNSKYSIIFYKWFSMNYNQYDTYKGTGSRNEEQLERLKNPYISMPELRRMTNTLKEYSRVDNFEARVLKPAKEEINEHTHFTMTYEKIKKGRSVVGIKFYIDKKQPRSALPYTSILFGNELISFHDMQDISLMGNLQTQVYPLYNQLKEKRGLNGVKEHLSYVAANQDGYSEDKQNIVKYLKISIQQYLQNVKIRGIE